MRAKMKLQESCIVAAENKVLSMAGCLPDPFELQLSISFRLAKP